MRKLYRILRPATLLAAMALFSGCNSESPDEKPEKMNLIEELPETSFLISPESRTVDASDASKMATLLHIREDGKSRSSASVSNAEVITIRDEETGIPLLYIVNQPDNGGYTVISASKKTTPIFAHSENGNLTPDENSPAYIMLQMYIQEVKQSFVNKADSSEIRYHALEWSLYENNTVNQSRAVSSDVQTMIANEIKRQTNKGYHYIGKLSDVSKYLPEDEVYALTMDIKTHSDPKYDYNEVCLFFIKSYDYEIIGPLIGTRWGQKKPFNKNSKNGFAGCYPIAIAQVAFYHKYPAKYNWSAMSKYYPDNTEIEVPAITQLIDDLQSYCKVSYNTDGTSTSDSNGLAAIRKLGFKASEQVAAFDYLRDQLQAMRPAIMTGHNPSTKKGHAWVCEGFQNKRYPGIISFIARPGILDPDQDPSSPYSEYSFRPYEPEDFKTGIYGNKYYMNFGWYGSQNGWYRYNAYDPLDPNNHNYTSNLKMVSISKP